MLDQVTMALYSLLLGCVLAVGSPYWLWRAAQAGAGWRSGLVARLGLVPRELRQHVAGKQVIWVHAVSVGEVLAAARLIEELEQRLGDGWRIVVSTTTSTGQALATERFTRRTDGATRVFYYPLDFAWAVRAYLHALNPKILVLMESELWPRMLSECRRAGVPVAVVNARVSDRSFARGMRVRRVWGNLLQMVTLFLAQSKEDARRLIALGAPQEAVHAMGNLKYDAGEPKQSEIVKCLDAARGNLRIVIAGSTLSGEELLLLNAWDGIRRAIPNLLLVVAPRQPARFHDVLELITGHGYIATLGSHLLGMQSDLSGGSIVLLNTIGDLAGAYSLADVAFVGGSLVPRGGHNPLEPARYGVPVVMGPSFENFRDIVEKMRSANGIRIMSGGHELRDAFVRLLSDCEAARAMGEHGRMVFEQQQGATTRTIDALMQLLVRDRAGHQDAATKPEATL